MNTVNQLVVDENNMAFHPAMGNSYQLNETGTLIINLLKQFKSEDEIMEILMESYDISKEELFIDFSDFMTKLRVYGLQ
jgi:hypothetical protein